jgi:hypothetical protein
MRRHKLDHASYRADLSALTPLYLDRLQINPHTDALPVYTRNAGGCVGAASLRDCWPSHRPGGRPCERPRHSIVEQDTQSRYRDVLL